MLNNEQAALVALAHAKMPFGKYKNTYITELPEYYLVWYQQKGLPPGKLGQMMQMASELRLNGLEPMIRKIRRENPQLR
jgi:uncharacterized protein